MLIVKERSLGEDVDRYALYTNIEIKKEFYVLKQKCQVETRRRCEAAVKGTIEEVSYNIKQGNLGQTEADLELQLDNLKQILMQILEPIYFAEKDAFVTQKCTEMEALAYKTTSRNLQNKGELDQGLLQNHIVRLEEDLQIARRNGAAQSEQERQEWSDKVQAEKNKAESNENDEIVLNAIRT